MQQKWDLAGTEADKLLVDAHIQDREYIQMCYAQSLIMSKVLFDLTTISTTGALEDAELVPILVPAQTFRNAVSFLMEGFMRAVQKKLDNLLIVGFLCFRRLTNSLRANNKWFGIIILPLLEISKALESVKAESHHFLDANLTLVDVVLSFLEAKKHGNSNEAIETIPWPSLEEYNTFLAKSATSTVVSKLEIILPYTNSNIISPFTVVRHYARLLKLQPSATSPLIEKLLASDKLLQMLSSMHGASTLPASDLTTLIHSVDGRLNLNHNSEEVFAFLMELAVHAAELGNLTASRQALEKTDSLLIKNQRLLVKLELVQLRLELLESASNESSAAQARVVKKLVTAAKKALDESFDSGIIKGSCLSAWSTISNNTHHQVHVVRVLASALKIICDIAESRPSLFEASLRCEFEHTLAQFYELQNIFSLSSAHADKALRLCVQPEKRNDIEILLHKLWIKANTFDGHLSADLKALSLADQAKYITEDAVAYQTLRKSIKTLVLDHDLISPQNLTESDDLIFKLLNVDYSINFEIISADDVKSKRTIVVALADIMRQSRELAAKQVEKKRILKYWKMVWDASKYLMTLELEALMDSVSAQKLKAEAQLLQGESLLVFNELKPHSFSETNTEDEAQSENMKRIYQAIVEPMVNSLGIGITLKDSVTIKSAASNIWRYFSKLKVSVSAIGTSFWAETFQHLFEGLVSCGLTQSDLMVQICIGYASILKEVLEHSNSGAQSVDEKSKAKPQADKKNQTKNPASEFQAPSTLKQLEDAFNVGFSAKDASYENKLALLDIKTSIQPPMASSINTESDPAMNVFHSLALLHSRPNPTTNELEEAAAHMAQHESKFSKPLSFEIWIRIVQYSMASQHLHLAFAIVKGLFEKSKDGIAVHLLLTGEKLFGEVILKLIENGMCFDSASVMRAMAIDKLANFIELKISKDVFELSKLMSVLDIVTSAVKCRGISTAAPQIERLLNAMYTAFYSKPFFQAVFNSTESLQIHVLSLFQTCIHISNEKQDWSASLRLTDKALRILPRVHHPAVIEEKVKATSKSGKLGMSQLLQDLDPPVRFKMWQMLTEYEEDPSKQREAYIQCLSTPDEHSDLRSELTNIQLRFCKWQIEFGDDEKEALESIDAFLSSSTLLNSFHLAANEVLRFQAMILKCQVTSNLREKSALMMSAFSCVMKLIELLRLAPVAVVDPKGDKPVIDAPVVSKSRAGTAGDRATKQESREKSIESWIGREWSQAEVDAFTTGNSLSLLNVLTMGDFAQYSSCLLYLVTELEEVNKLQHCIPLLSALNLAMATCLKTNEGGLIKSTLHLYTALIYSKMGHAELAGKYRKLYYALDLNDGALKNSKIHLGYPLNDTNLLVLTSKCLIQYGELLKAYIMLSQNLPAQISDSCLEMYYHCMMLKYANVANDAGLGSIFKVENKLQATVFAKFVHDWSKNGVQVVTGLSKNPKDWIELIDRALSLLETDQSTVIKLWKAKYDFLSSEVSSSTIQDIKHAFQECQSLYQTLEFDIEKAEHIYSHAITMRKTAAITTSGREKAKRLLKCLDLLLLAGELCDKAKSGVTIDPVWNLLAMKVELEAADLRYCIYECGDLIDADNRTIEIMIEECFSEDADKGLTEKWIGAQSEAVESVIATLSKNIAVYPQPLQTQGRKILGFCYKIMCQRLSDSDTEAASNYSRLAQNQLQRAFKTAVSLQSFETVALCAEELLAMDAGFDEIQKMTQITALQACENWEFIQSTWKQCNTQYDKPLLNGETVESKTRIPMLLAQNPSYKRTIPTLITIESLVDIPKNLKILVLKHSRNKDRLFATLLYRTKEAAAGTASKSKNPSEDFFVGTANFEVDADQLKRLLDRVEDIKAHSLKGAVPDASLLDDIYKYLEPALRVMDIDVSKIVEKVDTKKKPAAAAGAANAKATDSQEMDRGHCVICCDSLLEPLPLEIMLRFKKLASTASRDFGLAFILARIKSSPFYAPRPASASSKKEKPAAATADKWDLSCIKIWSSDEMDKEILGTVPANLKFEAFHGGNLDANQLSTVFEGAQAAVLIDAKDELDPMALSYISCGIPAVILHAPITPKFSASSNSMDSGKELAAFAFLNGASISVSLNQAAALEQIHSLVRNLIKGKDTVRYRADMNAEDLLYRRLIFGAHFATFYGVL
ncbi:hypothetical protein CcCBS67573_g05183 [Chytriomyces confervae]|uniref:Uncharacterized protein n=1 Tax=Chytriomyces confervae TaxID=246404 RepID=A0A507FBF7_9FUNG|nr:hypothetical protein CcCBS67573_g05183 [Chytriomyces confervae]